MNPSPFIQETEAAEKLRVTKMSLEVSNDKLEAELEETKQRLRAALSKAIPEGADSKTWKASVVTRWVRNTNLDTLHTPTSSRACVLSFGCRMFENKMKELETELSQKTSSLADLKRQLKEAREREDRAQTSVRQLEDQVQV